MPIFFPTFCTYMREFNLHPGGRNPSVFHSCPRCGFVSISKHPEPGRGGSTGGQLLPRDASYPPRSPTSSSQVSAQVPASPIPMLLGWVKFLWLCADNIPMPKRAQGDLLASSAGGQVELSLAPYSRHLCLSLQINTITLNPQAEQRELFLFKGNIKSL